MDNPFPTIPRLHPYGSAIFENAALAEDEAAQARLPSLLTTKPVHSGYGAFAPTSILPSTEVLRTGRPAAHVIFRPFRKEVCAWCFTYDLGRQWKIKTDNSPALGAVFCSEACRDSWGDVHGELERSALISIETSTQFQAKKTGKRASDVPDVPGATNRDNAPTPQEISEHWKMAAVTGSLIYDARSVGNPSKAQKRALRTAEDLLLTDTDILTFLITGIFTHHNASASWQSFLHLGPSTSPYYTQEALANTTNAYLQLLSILPLPFLSSVTPEVIHNIVARDSGNSFGIWSTDGRLTGPEGSEFLGYGVWPVASFFNHSCRPNVVKWREGSSWVFHSWATETRPGEELCITYLGGEEETLGLQERRNKLLQGWGFHCSCARCVEEENVIATERTY